MKNEPIHTYCVLAYKESPYLEECIKSVLNQQYKSNVVIATSTPNDYIKKLANKYSLELYINEDSKGIGSDYDFAVNCLESKIITIAHQDDIYNRNYSKEIVSKYKKNPKSLIIFTDYYEIKGDLKIHSNINFKIKRILLFPLRFNVFNKSKFWKRLSLRFGDPICCPAVSFVKENIKLKAIFSCDLVCSVDWIGWERLSKYKGNFLYIKEHLMGHRIHESSTTTQIINNDIRTKEDYEILKKFWIKPIAWAITKVYKNAEKSNKL